MTRGPSAVSSATSSATPGASAPRRLVSSRCSAPWRASHRATRPPSAPVPPVTSTVPLAAHWPTGSSASTRVRRRPSSPAARTATWSSAVRPATPPASRPATRDTALPSRSRGRSTRPPQCCGYSSATTRPNPHTCAWIGLASSSVRSTATAPRVTHHSGVTVTEPSTRTRSAVAARPRGTDGKSGCGRSSSASSDRTPAVGSPARAAPTSSASAARSSSPDGPAARPASHGRPGRPAVPCRRRTAARPATGLWSGRRAARSPGSRSSGTASRPQWSHACRLRRHEDNLGSKPASAESTGSSARPSTPDRPPRSPRSTADQKPDSAGSAADCSSWAAAVSQ